MMDQKIGIILAGGHSRRMGTDKAAFIYKGRRLIDHVYARLAPQVGEIMISGRTDYALGCPVITDRDDAPKGPVSGIVSVAQSLRETRPNASVFYTVPVDAPIFPDNIVAGLKAGQGAACNASVVARSPSGIQAVFACWNIQSVLESVQGLDVTASISLRRFASMCGAKTVDFESDTPFLNINEPGDASRAL